MLLQIVLTWFSSCIWYHVCSWIAEYTQRSVSFSAF